MPPLSLGEHLPSSSSDLEDALQESSESDQSNDEADDSQEEKEENNSIDNNDSDTQWISATDYFERRKAEYLLSKLSVRSPIQDDNSSYDSPMTPPPPLNSNQSSSTWKQPLSNDGSSYPSYNQNRPPRLQMGRSLLNHPPYF